MLERKTRGSHEFVCIVLSCVDPTSSPLGSAGALEMAARARSALRGRSTWPFELARLRQGARNCPAWLLEKHRTCRRFQLRTHSALLGRSTFALEPARPCWGARNRRSSPLGSAGPETLHWAGPRLPVALNTETNILVHGMHGYTLVYIYIYMYIYMAVSRLLHCQKQITSKRMI